MTYDDVEILGMIGTADGSEIRPGDGRAIDPDYTARFARAHEDGGFDRVLIGYGSGWAEGSQVAAYAAAHTERLGLLVAHRPGVVHPTLAARTFATLDQFSGGRVALNIVTGGTDSEQRREGDYLSHDERYARTDEYLGILRQVWDSAGPHSHEGTYYRFEDLSPHVRPLDGRHLELFFGGSSPAAYGVGAKRADTYMLWGEPLAETAGQIDTVAQRAAEAGRASRPRISVSFRPILGSTDAAAWERAHGILDTINGRVGAQFKEKVGQLHPAGKAPENAGSQRLLAVAAKGDVHDRCLWTPTTTAVGGGGNSTALVGSPETVAAAILDYVEIGVDTVLIRGYDPLQDAVDYGRDLLPLVRQELAHRAATRGQAEAAAV
ncbi:alkanesulfonate monooxygenase [Nocardioides sp. Root1257]|uniref:LLM class flavin-dependent oxidoreductase n=1 Tax=unclassified Nocardioides TaxID=2615069 RepID=UPI0006FFD450|nr:MULTISPECIES: LLM class flavin-dependent oxidoreductase [unclassified Nocardioides]KQW47880.1 alkanesulfonate monooxygenase [Nocardioides sp. Root1257]KRC45132.1 alkanesulfonate monooxygenase [Nocardioides sp. Root224]